MAMSDEERYIGLIINHLLDLESDVIELHDGLLKSERPAQVKALWSAFRALETAEGHLVDYARLIKKR